MEHRNVGAPFRQRDGTLIAHGQVFVPTQEDLTRRRYKLRPVAPVFRPREPAQPVVEVSPLSASVPAVEESEPSVSGATPDWPLRVQPDLYLRLYPGGVHADAARRLTGASDDDEA